MRILKAFGLIAALGLFAAPGVHAQANNPDGYGNDVRFGAISVAAGQPLIYAGATNYTSPREASNAARRACQKKGGQGCQTAIGFEDGCGALASGDGGRWVAVKAEYRADAKDAVLAKCNSDGLNGCKVEIVSCSDDAI